MLYQLIYYFPLTDSLLQHDIEMQPKMSQCGREWVFPGSEAAACHGRPSKCSKMIDDSLLRKSYTLPSRDGVPTKVPGGK